MPVEAHMSRENKVPRPTFQALTATCEIARVQLCVFKAGVLCFSGFTGIHYGMVFSDIGGLIALQSQQLKAPGRKIFGRSGRSVWIFT